MGEERRPLINHYTEDIWSFLFQMGIWFLISGQGRLCGDNQGGLTHLGNYPQGMTSSSLEMMKMYVVGEFQARWLFLFKVLKLPNSSLQTGLWFPGQLLVSGSGPRVQMMFVENV